MMKFCSFSKNTTLLYKICVTYTTVSYYSPQSRIFFLDNTSYSKAVYVFYLLRKEKGGGPTENRADGGRNEENMSKLILPHWSFWFIFSFEHKDPGNSIQLVLMKFSESLLSLNMYKFLARQQEQTLFPVCHLLICCFLNFLRPPRLHHPDRIPGQGWPCHREGSEPWPWVLSCSLPVGFCFSFFSWTDHRKSLGPQPSHL